MSEPFQASQLVAKTPDPESIFADPIDVLTRCHERILKKLDSTIAILASGHLTDASRSSLETSLNYFLGATATHNADEEASLFPRVAESSPSDSRALIIEALAGLETQHRVMPRLHKLLDKRGRAILVAQSVASAQSDPEPSIPDPPILEVWDSGFKLATALKGLYVSHIEFEETVVYAAAEKFLSAESIKIVGHEMKSRRILDPGRDESICAQRRRKLAV